MFYVLTNSIKKRLVILIQDILKQHPIFDKVKVYTKFPQEERPKFAIIVRSVAGSSMKMDLNNLVGIDRGYSTLANLKGIVGGSIEWVRDDYDNIEDMSAPGFYIVKVTEHQQDTNEFKFVIDPYLRVDDEELKIEFLENTEGGYLKNVPINQNSEIVFSQSHSFEFKPKLDYTIDYQTGKILFKESVKNFEPIVVDYQVLGKRMGPFSTEYYKLNNVAVPGVVLAFGDRLRVGDEQVVVVDKEQRPIAKVFGGRWLLDVDILVVAQDPDQQERIADFVVSRIWLEQEALANEGIAIHDFSLTGEAEEPEIDEEYNFTAGIAFSIETDWEMFIPLITEVRKISLAYGKDSFKEQLDYVTEDKYDVGQYDERMLDSDHHKGIEIVPSLDSIQTYPSPFPRVDARKYD